MAKKRNEKGIACHEAGHAVAAWRLGIKFKSITIIPSKHYAGRVFSNRLGKQFLINAQCNQTPRTVEKLEKLVVVLLAGGEAARLVMGRFSHYATGTDYSEAQKHLEILSDFDDERRAYFKLLLIRTQNLVKRWRPQIESLATELTTKKTLTGVEARAIIIKTIRKEEPRALSEPLTQKQTQDLINRMTGP